MLVIYKSSCQTTKKRTDGIPKKAIIIYNKIR